MLLPTKGVSADRALLTVGSEILEELGSPMSVTTLWEKYRRRTVGSSSGSHLITFDWFSLALAFLFTATLVEFSDDGYLRRADVS